jgi:serine/threonine protein kinase
MSTSLNFLSKQPILNDRYIIKKELGTGTTSTVYECLDKQTNETKAAKIYNNNAIVAFKKELKILEKISEINSNSHIKCYESGIGFLTQEEKTTQKMFVILELGDHGSLFDAIYQTKKGFSEDVCKFLLFKILNAADDLHKNGICHRDIKSENMILVGKDYDLKLCDFGLSAKFLNNNNERKKLKRQIGTECYCAPEILEGKEYDGDKVDIFSIGAVLFILMTKNFGFKDARINNSPFNTKQILYKLIKDKQYKQYWEILETKFKIAVESEKFKNLYLKMVAYEPEERPTIEEIKKDEWMQDIMNANPEQLTILKNKMISEMNLQSS